MKSLCILLLCWLVGTSLSAQVTRKTAKNPHTEQQVLHFGDFIGRFNADSGKDRKAALEELFDQDDPRRNRSHPAFALYKHIVSTFTEEVTRENIRIPAAYPAEAAVGIAASYRGKPDTLIVNLKKEYTPDHASYWHVVAARSLPQLPEDTRTRCTSPPRNTDLPPNSHEVSFLPLLRGILDYRSLCPFTNCQECIKDDWQRIETALQNGNLVVENVSSVTLTLLAGNGWRMEIREFIREKDNAGWLISDVTPL